MAGDLSWIDAIDELQELGYAAKEAESMVDQWDEER